MKNYAKMERKLRMIESKLNRLVEDIENEDEEGTNKKYELTDETVKWNGHTLYRIRALKNFDDVKAGDLGGFVESEKNLSQSGKCWIYDEAGAFENAKVYDDAKLKDDATVLGNASVYENAKVHGNAEVRDQAKVYGDVWLYENAEVFGHAQVYGNAEVEGWSTVWG